MLREETENCFCVGFINGEIAPVFAGDKLAFSDWLARERICLAAAVIAECRVVKLTLMGRCHRLV